MRDINTNGDVNGGIYVNEGPEFVDYRHCSSEVLQLEDARLRANRSILLTKRYRKMLFGIAAGAVLVVAGLWALNTLDPDIVGIIGVAAGIGSVALSARQWGSPNIDESNVMNGINEIRQILRYRQTPGS